MTDIPDKAAEIIRPSIETILEKFVDELTQQQRNYIADQFCRIVAAAPFMQPASFKLSEQDQHCIDHMQYQVDRSTSDEPVTSFDFDLVAQVLRLIARLRTAGTFADGIEAAAKLVEEGADSYIERWALPTAIRALAPPEQKERQDEQL